MTYCLIPEGLGGRTHRALERYAEETGVSLVAERRGAERRAANDRRTRERTMRFRSIDRRTIHNNGGRRVAERRAASVPVTPPGPLPRRLRSHADEIHFVEPLEVSPEHLEDIATARLMVRIQGGEAELFRSLYEQWFDRVYTYTRAVLDRAVLAEVATQEVFAEIYDALPRHEIEDERFRAWIAEVMARRVQAHMIVLHGSEAVASVQPAHAGAEVERVVPKWVKDVDLHVLIAQLPLPQREVMLMRYLMRLSQIEVGDIVERSAAVVGELHASALSVLAERQQAIGEPSAASSVRFAMARRRRSARVLQSRRLALVPG
jgi:DNA-directed RNA polymerase specialized sigma24 family protein